MHRNDKQKLMKRAILVAAMASALYAVPLVANAAGMGKITVLSALGQPLRAELDITASREELGSLAARVAPVEAFRQANVEYAPALSTVRFTLDKRPDGKPYFKIQTDRAVNDPFIDFLVELSWSSGRLVREYAFLLDPPELKTDNAPVAVTAPVTPAFTDTTAHGSQPAAEPAQDKKARPAPVESQKPRAASEAVSVAEGAANTRTVKTGDTLGKIAAKSATAGVTLDQMLVALFNSNRDAFLGGNMNRLRAGRILNIPDAEKAAAVSAAEAHKIVVVQSAAFNAYRSSLAAAAANQAPVEQKTQQSSSGKITPKVEEKAPSASGQDKLQVSRSEAQSNAGKGKLSEEDIVARDKALKEANSRIGELEKNLADLKKLAELKSQAAVDAQKAAQAAKSAPSPAPAAAVAVKPAASPEPAQKGITVAAPAPDVLAPAAAPAAEKPQPKPKKKIIPPPPQPEPGFIESNPLLVYGSGAAIAAILGFLGFSTWKRRRDGASSQDTTANDLAASSIFGTATGEIGAAAQSDFGHSTMDAVDTGKQGVDPIQEAEVYMAYGRDGQAEEILVDAMQKDPGNLAVYLKLLEIYAGRKSLPQFSEVANELHTRTGGSGSEWSKAAALGRSVDPGNPLYGGATSSESAQQGQTAAIEGASDGQSMEATMVMGAPPLQEPPAPVIATPATEEIAPSALDFDFDLDSTAPAPAVPEPVKAAPAAAEDVSSTLDFDLDLGSAAPADAVAAETKASDLDFDLESDEKPSGAAEQIGGLDINFNAPAESGNSIDFDIAAPAASGTSDAPATEATEAHGESGLDFDFDLGESASAAFEQSSPPLDLSSINLDLGEPAAPATAGNAGDSPEASTKLELAQAYEEMGDKEGARELLQEVLEEGSPAQQEAARNKLAQLG